MLPNRHARWFFFVITVAALVLIAAVPSSSPKDPWKGTWWRIDPYGDESLERVVFAGGTFKYVDWGASVCGTDENNDPIYAAHARGSADTMDSTSFVATVPVICMAHPPFTWAESWEFAWNYDPATNTLWDGGGGGTPWTRTKP